MVVVRVCLCVCACACVHACACVCVCARARECVCLPLYVCLCVMVNVVVVTWSTTALCSGVFPARSCLSTSPTTHCKGSKPVQYHEWPSAIKSVSSAHLHVRPIGETPCVQVPRANRANLRRVCPVFSHETPILGYLKILEY